MKKFTTPYSPKANFQTRCHMLVLLVCLGVGVAGRMPESGGGWFLEPTTGWYLVQRPTATRRSRPGRRIRRGRSLRWARSQLPAAKQLLPPYIARTGPGMCWRSLLLAGLGWGSGQETLSWTLLFPWLVWGWQLVGLGLGWRSQPEWRAGCWLGRQVERLLLLAGLCALLEAGFRPIAHWLRTYP